MKGKAMRYIVGLLLLVLAVAFLGALVATAICSGATGFGKVSNLILGGLGGLIVWIIANYVGKPILRIEAKRREAIDVAEGIAYLRSDDDQYVREAITAIGNVGATLRSYARTPFSPVLLYCRLLGYDLDGAARAMYGLARISGEYLIGDDPRKDTLDWLHVCLNAYAHLSTKRVYELRRLAAAAEREQSP
jgi:hypothetical protein